tara:strand:- start:1886 stop:2560 length:675 start_codon:yes stop_codon:yes gene_type:complete
MEINLSRRLLFISLLVVVLSLCLLLMAWSSVLLGLDFSIAMRQRDKIVIFGDSWVTRFEKNNDYDDVVYVGRSGWTVEELGVSGSIAKLTSSDSNSKSIKGRQIYLFIGLNDWIKGLDEKDVGSRILRLVGQLNSSGMSVFIVFRELDEAKLRGQYVVKSKMQWSDYQQRIFKESLIYSQGAAPFYLSISPSGLDALHLTLKDEKRALEKLVEFGRGMANEFIR